MSIMGMVEAAVPGAVAAPLQVPVAINLSPAVGPVWTAGGGGGGASNTAGGFEFVGGIGGAGIVIVRYLI
jgi:hypothetical protein